MSVAGAGACPCGRADRLHETSSFVKEADGHWYYVDGVIQGLSTG